MAAHSIAKTLLLFTLVLGATACRPPPPTCTPVPTGGTPVAPPPIGLAGAPLGFNLASPLAICDMPVEQRRVTLEVRDEGNLLVESAIDSVGINPGLQTVIAAHVTAARAGPLYVRATFEPSLGVVSTTVHAAADLTAATPIEETFAQSLADCSPLLRTTSGAVLCQRGGVVSVFRGGAPAGTFPGSGLAVVGDVVWSTTPSALERREDLGPDAGVVLSPGGLAPCAPLASPVGVHTETRAVRATQGSFTFAALDATWDGGAMTTRSFNPTEPVPGASQFAVESDKLWVLTPGDGMGREAELCSYADERECIGLFSNATAGPPRTLGLGASGAWWVNPTFGSPQAFELHFAERPFSGRAPRLHVVELQSPEVRVTGDQISGETVPLIALPGFEGTVLATFSKGEIRFERWPDGKVHSVSADWLVQQVSPSTFRFYRRR